MKSIITLLFILTFGAIALANNETHAKIDVIKVGVVLGDSVNASNPTSQIEVDTENGIARLYKLKNSRVKRALSFTTKYTKTKLV